MFWRCAERWCECSIQKVILLFRLWHSDRLIAILELKLWDTDLPPFRADRDDGPLAFVDIGECFSR
jgi:hypothetical protein